MGDGLDVEWVEGNGAPGEADGAGGRGFRGGYGAERGRDQPGVDAGCACREPGVGLSRPRQRTSRRCYEKLRQDPLAHALVTRLARKHRVSLRDLTRAGRGSGNASHTRQIAMYLCHVLLRRTQEQLGELFNRDRKTVSYACAQIELLRETDRALDRELVAFETEGWIEAACREQELPRDAA